MKTPVKPPMKEKGNSQVIVRPREAEVVAPEAAVFPLIESDEAMRSVVQLIDVNMGSQKFSAFNLSRIKTPAGGGPDFLVQGAAGVKSAHELSGVIVAFRQARAYWKRAGASKKPPDCASQDGFIGVGDPGGECAVCPFSQFGTALTPEGTPGAGQACKDVRQLLMLLPGQLLPHLFNVPPTSIKSFLQYSMNLVSAGAAYWSVITRITPEPATSTGGHPFARVTFQLERRLNAEQTKRLEQYHKRMRAFLQPMTVDATVYEVEEQAESAQPEAEAEDIPF